jgi:hypothetical protein
MSHSNAWPGTASSTIKWATDYKHINHQTQISKKPSVRIYLESAVLLSTRIYHIHNAHVPIKYTTLYTVIIKHTIPLHFIKRNT